MLSPDQIDTIIKLQQTSFMALQTSFLAWGTIFTVVFAYLAGVFYFIRHRALVIRIAAFAAFAFVLVFLIWSTNIHFQQVHALMDLILFISESGLISEMNQMGSYSTEGLDASFVAAVWTYNLFFCAVLLGLGYMTLFYSWPGRGDQP